MILLYWCICLGERHETDVHWDVNKPQKAMCLAREGKHKRSHSVGSVHRKGSEKAKPHRKQKADELFPTNVGMNGTVILAEG